MIVISGGGRSLFALLACAGGLACAMGEANAQVLATPSPSPSPAATPGFRLSVDSHTEFISTAAAGPGLSPPEAPGFINGSTLSPNTPYDLWSSAPQTPGVAGIGQFNLTGTYAGRRFDASATIGAASVTGSMNNTLYWGENLMPALNSHLGSSALPYRIAFPVHAGDDDATASAIAPLSASVGAHDGSWRLRGGYLDVLQSDNFVFVAPPLTNVTPNVAVQPAESLGNGPPALDVWPSPEPGLPLHGVDLAAHRGLASLEVTNAALPALPGDSARADIGSLVFDHGEGTRYSLDYVHVTSAGTPIFTTTFYGADPHATPGPQGNIASSTLGGQTETIAGGRAAFHLTRTVDSVVEIGRTWYDADLAAHPETNRPGGFYHLGFSRHWANAMLGADLYRDEARYANAILPYGIPENVWSTSWAWPGVWLKSTYQLVDNTQAPGSNRQGYRLRYKLVNRALEVRAAFSRFRQIEPATYANMQQEGFVDGFFLPQSNDSATCGIEHQYNVWLAWHRPFGDLVVDYANDTLHRDSVPAHPEDAVSYQTPQAVLSFTHTFSKAAIVDAGYGRYAMKGTWAQPFTNVDYFQNVAFIGTQLAESAHAVILVQLRHSQFAGLPASPGGSSPLYGATTLVLEQRLHF